MKTFSRILIASAAGMFALAPHVLAQQTQLPQAPEPEKATLSGDVIDSHDALVPGATIVATEVAGPHESVPSQKEELANQLAAQTTKADDAGHFVLRLAPGTWAIHVSAPELQSFQNPQVELKPGEIRELQGVMLNIPAQHADVTVTLTMEQVAEQQIQDQEKQRTLAIFPNFNTSYVWNAAPMNAKQKAKLSLRSSLDPVGFFTAAAVSGYQYERNKYPEYGSGGAETYAKYYGAAWGTIFISHTISYAILPAVFHQDPRYFYMGPGASVKTRAIHAITSGFLCRGDSGHRQFDFSKIGGHFIAGYISKTYHANSDNGIGLAVDNTLIGVVGQAGVNLVREFVLRRISTGTPKYGNGKPPKEAVDPSHP